MSDEFNFDFDDVTDPESIENEIEIKENNTDTNLNITIQKDIELSAYFLKKLYEKKLINFPWPHMKGKNIFPKNIIDDFKNNIPNTEKFLTDEQSDLRKFINLFDILTEDKNSNEEYTSYWKKIQNMCLNVSLVEHVFKYILNIPDLDPSRVQLLAHLIYDKKGFVENPIIPIMENMFNVDIYLTPTMNDRVMYFLETLQNGNKQFVKIDELDFKAGDFFAAVTTEMTWQGTNELKEERWMLRLSFIVPSGMSKDDVFDFDNEEDL